MRKFKKFFNLKKEALLLDSKLYILKAFMAAVSAYFISHHNSILSKDIISVLFGLALTLEPATFTGIKNGLNQIYATVLGAVSTAIIIYFFGINTLTVAISISFTLYVALKIDWRAVSPVAIFTAIYMTQYVQNTPQGDPSILLTFRLRMAALGTGVLIAIIFNFIFSFLYYEGMLKKRLNFLLQSTIEHLRQTFIGVKEKNTACFSEVKTALPQTFNHIDWVFSTVEDIKVERKYKIHRGTFSTEDLERIENIILFIRNINHLNYDISYILSDKQFQEEENGEKMREKLEGIIESLERIKQAFEKNQIDIEKQPTAKGVLEEQKQQFQEEGETNYNRFFHDLEEMTVNVERIRTEIGHVNYLKR